MDRRDLMQCVHGQDKVVPGRGAACVLGSSRAVWDELRLVPPGIDVIAVNLVGCFIPNIKHWVSLHKEMFEAAEPLRAWLATHHTAPAPTTHAWRDTHPNVDCVWYGDTPPDKSGCFGVMLALSLGYAPVYVCGIHHDQNGHVYEPYGVLPEVSYAFTCSTWHTLAASFSDTVRPVSGPLKCLFEGGAL